MAGDDDTEYHDPPKDGPITELFAFIASDETGDGIMAAGVGDSIMPLVVSQREIALGLIRLARHHARAQDKRCKLVRFSNREDIEEIN
jgi:hypothetical protein